MHARLLVTGIAMALTVGAQSFQRKATMTGGGGRDQGQCSVEVTVDGSAQIEIRGDTATLRNTQGAAPQWRRFECTSALPANPVNLQVDPIAGRGSQALVGAPRGGGPAVVQINDTENGPDLYRFEMYWGERRGSGPPAGFRDGRDGDRDRGDRDRGDRGGGRFTREQAVEVCRNSIRAQATDRFNTPNIDISRIAMDDNPGRQDWVIGDLSVRRRFGRQNVYGFTCSVNFDTGAVRNARIDQFEKQYYPPPNGRR